MTSVTIGTIATFSVVKWCVVGMAFHKGTRIFKQKEVAKSWTLTQFLEESK